MKIISNYLNNLQNYLPEDLKQEVTEELEASIYGQVDDKQEELGRELNQIEIEQILLAIGHPMRVAAAYQPNQQLIGQDYFPAYKKALEIALIIVLGIKLLMYLPALLSGDHFIRTVIQLTSQSFESALCVFAVVTIIFHILQKNKVGLNQIYAWSPSDLMITSRRVPISRLESLFEIIMAALFIGWWNNIFAWPGVHYSNEFYASAQFSVEWSAVTLSVNLIVGLGIVVNLHKLIFAGWNKSTLVSNILLNLAALVILIQIGLFDHFVIFNEVISDGSEMSQILEILNSIVYSTLAFIGLITIWDIYSSYKKL